MLNAHFSKRRQALLEKLPPNSMLILYSGVEKHKSADQNYAFQPDTDFYYLTGFTEPDAFAILRPQGQFILFSRPRDPERELWDGRRAGQEGACKLYGATQAFSTDELTAKLSELLLGVEQIFYPLGRYAHLDKLIVEQVLHLRGKIRAGIAAPQQLCNSETLMHPMRRTKDAYEIELMRKACAISAEGHVRAMRSCKPGMYEYEVEAELIYEFRRQGCKNHAYNPIVGGGANACILHYNDNNAKLQDGDLLLIDAGGEYQGYAADITRTFPINGKFSKAQRILYDLVLEAQLAVINIIKPGLPYHKLQQTAIEVLTTGLVNIGILNGDVEELIATQAYKAFYMHNIGHWLGLDTHDVGSYKESDQWVSLQPGYVLTVEPGLYIPAGSPGVAKQWWDIGIRIEDNVLVTETGYEILTQGVPKTVAEIERLMARS